ncbi:heat shock protein 27-like [Phlebotomus papatasi]|uniref:heat shock protein 27-like n=1 Tax=Phlebotomus papatasi TaxID=29031 RepID=UPI0024838DD6|nr:heat shock protein 27-like [Phlebotomus papatasi]
MSVLPVILNIVEDFSDMDPWTEISSIPREFRMIHRKPRFLRAPYNSEKRCKLTRKYSKSPEKDGFEMNLDVKQFRPEEISVKAVDNHVVVEAKHEEREDENSFVSRHFVSRYSLPKDCDVQELVSSLSSDGVLTLKAPPLHKGIKSKERVIEIQRINTPHLPDKEKSSENHKDTTDENPEK